MCQWDTEHSTELIEGNAISLTGFQIDLVNRLYQNIKVKLTDADTCSEVCKNNLNEKIKSEKLLCKPYVLYKRAMPEWCLLEA